MPEEKTKWPSIKEQLSASRAAKESALDKLIRANQDFHMLRPEEAHDRLPYPHWLRVHWRKHHPDADYSGPSGGYPLTLVRLHEWMVEHQDLVTEPPTRQKQPGPAAGREGKKGERSRGK
jgi:hypothetical protein